MVSHGELETIEMGLVSAPKACFEDFPDYPYETQYVDITGPEMASIDEGNGDETFLCFHGEPEPGLPLPDDGAYVG